MKLSSLTILIIGLVVGLIAAFYGYAHHWMPNKAEAQLYTENNQKLEAEAAKMNAAKKRVEKALAMVEEKAAQWRATVASNTPPTSLASGGIDLSVNPYQLVIDTKVFRNNIQRVINAQVKRGGVTVVSGPEVPASDENSGTVLASFYNYPAFTFPVVLFDLGQVTVTGTYDQIMANVRSWSGIKGYLAVADGLQLSGTSPNLTGTYNVSVVGFIKEKVIYPSIDAATAPAGQPAPGGQGGGRGAGGGRGGRTAG